jgi:hypothetical protein
MENYETYGFENPGTVCKKSADSGQLSLLTGPLV